jgi:hypothetical protein
MSVSRRDDGKLNNLAHGPQTSHNAQTLRSGASIIRDRVAPILPQRS